MFYLRKTDKYSCAGIFSLVALLLFCCGSKPKQSNLFNMDSLVSEQVSYLTEHQAKLHKTAIINGVKDDSLFTADTATWKNELGIFRQLQSINKPVNRAHYIVDDGLFDPASNLTVKAFTDTTDLPVRYLRIFYQESLTKPRKIEALYHNKNPLYSSSRLLTLEFGHFKNRLVLSAYTIEGGQQMKMGDSVMFKIKGEVILN
jgi:hypothetical protein